MVHILHFFPFSPLNLLKTPSFSSSSSSSPPSFNHQKAEFALTKTTQTPPISSKSTKYSSDIQISPAQTPNQPPPKTSSSFAHQTRRTWLLKPMTRPPAIEALPSGPSAPQHPTGTWKCSNHCLYSKAPSRRSYGLRAKSQSSPLIKPSPRLLFQAIPNKPALKQILASIPPRNHQSARSRTPAPIPTSPPSKFTTWLRTTPHLN
jgi:hypothetical protein